MTLTATTLLAALAGLAAAGGLVLVIAGSIGWAPASTVRRRSHTERKVRALLGMDRESATVWWAGGTSRVGAGICVGMGVWLFTSWPLGGLISTLIVFALPWLLNPGSQAKAEIARLEAVEEWVRRMSDIHTVGVSLEQSVQRSLQTVPEGIRPEVTLLVSRLTAGWQPQAAYRAFADTLSDATVDEVIALLILHVEDRGAGLSRALRDLAAALQHEVLTRREVEADREKPRTNDRWVTIFCLVIFGVSMLSGAYVAPYSTITGQFVLVGIGIAFVLVKVWMRRMAVVEPAPRFLSRADRAGGMSTTGEKT